jgi:hypothetical protein
MDLEVPAESMDKIRVQMNLLSSLTVHHAVTNIFKSSWHRRLRSFAMAFCAFSALAAGAKAQSRWATLEAIHCLENPSNRRTPGPCGELGAYQFRATTWHQYSQRPFSSALNRQASDEVAARYYAWLKAQVERAGYPATSYNIALAWNGGLTAVSGRATRSVRDYAQRASNLAADFDHRTAAQ